MELELKKFEQLKASGELPSPKGAALNIVRLAQRDNVSSSQLEQAIKSDPAFVGRLLKTANITGRESGRPIASVPDAVNVLGLSVVRNLALGFSLVSSYRSGACTAFDYSAFWTRAIVNALALQSIVRRTHWANPEEAFCCGLLSGIGKLALATVYPREYALILGRLESPGINADDYGAALRAAEREAFALDHDDLTAAMLSEWGFPRVLLEPIYFCHNPDAAGFVSCSRAGQLLGAVRLAEVVTDVCMLDAELRQPLLTKLSGYAEALKLEREVLESIVDGVVGDWREWAMLLQLDSPEPVPAFFRMLQSEQGESVENGAKTEALLRVLLAVDDVLQRKILHNLLLDLGYEVFESDHGQQALELALTVQPQVLIADRQIPALDGIQLTRALREMRPGRGIYVLILIAVEDEDCTLEAFEAGADDCLTTPVSGKMLAARLRTAIRVFELQEEVRRDHEQMKSFAAELALSNRRLHEASITDPLTGFYNRRYAMERIEKEWVTGNRSGRPLSCMMIDLDGFKQTNDTYGHDVGDKVLMGISGVLKESLCSKDVICRIGGDEFLVICPDSDTQAVRVCAERLLVAAERLIIDTPHGEVRCGMSIGVATRSASLVDPGMLIKAADEGMYRAKIGGRGRVVTRTD